MKKNIKVKSIAIATAITTLLSATAVFANTTSSNTVQAPKTYQTQCETNGTYKSHLDSLISSGTLDKVQEDTIKDGMAKGEFNRGHHNGQFVNVLDGLVKAGTITQDQEDAIKGAMTPAKEDEAAKVDIKTVLDGLVKADTITQAQGDAIQSAIKPAVEAVPAVEAKAAVEAVPASRSQGCSRSCTSSGS